MHTYKLIAGYKEGMFGIIRSDGASIPQDTANTDYQEYLKWLDEGNEPEPTEE